MWGHGREWEKCASTLRITNSGVATPMWVLIQALWSGVRGCRCNMYRWMIGRITDEWSVGWISGIVGGWLIVGVTTTRSKHSTHSRGTLRTKIQSRTRLRATHACYPATSNCVVVVAGLSMSRIWTAIWSQSCSMEFISGRLDGQSMTSTSWFSRKSLVARAVWGRALSWIGTKLFRKMALA